MVLPVEPMLLSNARAWPAGGDWVLEPKWDGFRVLAAVNRSGARAWTRHGTDISAPLGAVLDELADRVPAGTVLDGELVALATGPDGRIGQDFSRLAPAVFAGRPYPLVLVVFDAPRWTGEWLTTRPWHERRARLEQVALAQPGRHVTLVHTFPAEIAVHEQLLALGFEGSVLERRAGRYRPGQRSTAWRKVKTRTRTHARLELVHLDRDTKRAQRVACRTAHDPTRLTWAVVWGGELAAELSTDPAAAVGRAAELTYTHRTVAGAQHASPHSHDPPTRSKVRPSG